MSFYKRRTLFLLTLILCLFLPMSKSLFAQSNLNLKTELVRFNTPFTNQNYAWTKNEFLNYSPGLSISYEFFLIERTWSNRITAAFLLPEKSSPVFSLGNCLHLNVYNKWRTAVNLSAGIGITNQPESTDKQAPILHPIAAVELNRSLNEKTDFSISVGNHYPNTISINAGIRYWFSKKIKRKKGCLACPD